MQLEICKWSSSCPLTMFYIHTNHCNMTNKITKSICAPFKVHIVVVELNLGLLSNVIVMIKTVK